ncbi:MAG: DUF447 family protein [Desulfurococcales archaeon]|nr:DUF447 family protein [Desulfurococcales archaeon]
MKVRLAEYLRHGHHEAVAVTLGEGDLPNAAPMGVDLGSDDELILKPYLKTETFKNLMRVPELTLNFTVDSLIFFDSLLNPQRIKYIPAKKVKPPVINGPIDLYVEGRVESVEVDLNLRRAYVRIRPVNLYEGPGSRLGFSRADAALIEALIYLTKAEALKSEVGPEVMQELLNHVRRSLSLADRLGSKEIITASRIIKERMKKLGVVLGGA